MNDKALYWGSMIFGGLALLFLVANVCLVNSNRNIQADIAQRQAAINNANGINQLNQALIQALAQGSVNGQDKQMGELLSSQGITLKSKNAAAAAAPVSDNAEKKK